MAKPINMPQVGQDIKTGIITEWRVKENDTVKKGDIVAVVESDKASFEVESFESGVILKRLYKEGDAARVLEPIAYVGEPGEKLDEAIAGAAVEKPVPARPGSGDGRDRTVTSGRIFATPSARRLAREKSVDLSRLSGSGPHGRILKRDVLSAAVEIESPEIAGSRSASEIQFSAPDIPAAPQVLPADQSVPFSKIRQRIAARLTRSVRDIPHFHLFIDVDMTPARAWRAAFNDGADHKVTVNDLIVKAAAAALLKYRGLNAHASPDGLVLKKSINIGVAVSTPEGLLVPVIENADTMDLAAIGRAARQIAEGARRGVLKAQAPGTFTISNLGMYSISFFLPIINPPEVAILGVGAIEKRVVPTGASSMGIRDRITLTLACDHRAVDGTEAAKFLREIKRILEQYI